MSRTVLDNIDRKLLGLLQMDFPLTGEPYADLGLKLGISGDEVMQRIHQLKSAGIVRQLSPVLDARRLGYRSTLVAMKVPTERLETARQVIVEHPGVSHGYERDHEFNVWITLAVPRGVDIDAEMAKLASATGAEVIFGLPAVKVFKLRTYFGADGEAPSSANNGSETALPSREAELSRLDKLVINGLQQDLPLAPEPFAPLAAQLGMDVVDFLAQCRSLLARGIMRRFGAAINHHGAGYKANAMTGWAVPPALVDAVGRKLASLREVSHCYERKTNALWKYNLFAMIHGSTRESCRETVSQVSGETGLTDYVVLFSTREFKKIRVKYLV
ncbi:MAG: AsnC family transcriptional regulator [Chloroflexota bacterium]|nr:AsnC family transcriptional regulator [Chloroflexota bacterium]